MTELVLRSPRSDVAAVVRRHAWIAAAWAAGRCLVLVPAAVVHFAGPRAFAGSFERRGVLGLLDAWDGRWYGIVAAHGYLLEPGRQSDPAFFPLFPLLLRAVHAAGLGLAAAGLVISNVGFLVALAGFATFTADVLGATLARRATTLLAVFPMSFVFSMSYPESIVLAAISWTAVAAHRGRWTCAAVGAALGTLARPETAFAVAALLPLALRERPDRRRGIALGAVAAPFAALAGFALYLGLRLHDPLAWTHAERAWGRRFTPYGIVVALGRLPRLLAGNPWLVRDVAFFAIYLVLLALALRAGTPRRWVLAGVLVVVAPTFSGSFDSIGRFGLLAPAIFWGLGSLASTPRRERVLRVACAALLVAGTVTIPFVFP